MKMILLVVSALWMVPLLGTTVPLSKHGQRGAVLLLDEIDLASNKILCLQSALEGKGVSSRRLASWVTPAAGFQIFATANTKGKGSDDGRFIGTNVLNEAFLERFPVTFEQMYPSPATEQKILWKVWRCSGPWSGRP
jgi:MoxR-like ATPase